MSTELSESTLVQAAQHGDLEAFNRLIDRYQSLLFRIAFRILGDEDDAADATQMAWIAAFRKFNEFRGGHLRTWLARVVVNTCYDEIRRQRRRREVPLMQPNAEGDEMEPAAWLADPAPGVEESVDAAEFEEFIQTSLQGLTPVYRAMLVLVDVEGLDYEEAAHAAGVPVGTVRSRLARARMALREDLRDHADLLPSRQRYQIQAAGRAKVRCQ